jgi:membrane protein DedA with SNARE-associated domain
MDLVLDYLTRYKYLAMFGILFLCGVGLPIPEEVTLVGSGLLVGWREAEFLPTSIACVVGILAGDSIIFGLGYFYGQRFLNCRPMRFLVSTRRQEKVGEFFGKHGNKAVFFARFFAGVRIGVYAYAGSQRIGWIRFLFLDFLGAMISGPTSVWIGKWAAERFADSPEEAATKAMELAHNAGHWILGAILVLAMLYLGFFLWRRQVRRSKAATKPADASSPSASEASQEGESEPSSSSDEVPERQGTVSDS